MEGVAANLEIQQEFVNFVSQDGKFTLNEPIGIQVSDADQDGVFVVTDNFSTVFGSGETPAEAKQNYASNLFAYFDELQEEEDALSLGMKQELKALRRHVIRR
jgi:predicted RNase H-like HicB family nuclease